MNEQQFPERLRSVIELSARPIEIDEIVTARTDVGQRRTRRVIRMPRPRNVAFAALVAGGLVVVGMFGLPTWDSTRRVQVVQAGSTTIQVTQDPSSTHLCGMAVPPNGNDVGLQVSLTAASSTAVETQFTNTSESDLTVVEVSPGVVWAVSPTGRLVGSSPAPKTLRSYKIGAGTMTSGDRSIATARSCQQDLTETGEFGELADGNYRFVKLFAVDTRLIASNAIILSVVRGRVELPQT